MAAEPLRIQQIRQFVITAMSGSFRAAATGTFRSQAAVSAAMRHLERQVGGKLFEEGRRAKLTPLAQSLFPIFQDLLATHDRAVADVRQLALAERGSVSLAVIPFLSEEWLAKLLIEFGKDHPDIRVRATDQRSHQIRNLVADGTVDIGIASWAIEDPKLTCRPIAVDSFGALCSRDHPLAQKNKPVPWSALEGEKFIGSDVFELVRGRGLGEGVDDPAMIVTSRPSLMNCVRAKLGITLVPMLTRPIDMNGLAFVPLIRPRIPRTIGIITRQSQTLMPAAAAMLDSVTRSLTQYTRGRGAVIVGSGENEKKEPAKRLRIR